MEALLLYQIKVAFLVATFLLGYRLLLRSETFYGFNRIVLIIMALLSFALPFFQITRDTTMFGNLFERENNKTKTEDVVSIVPNQTVAETTSTAVVVNNDNSITVPAATAVQTEMEENTAGSIAEQGSTQKNKTTLLTILCILYVIGVLFVLLKKAVSLWSMSRIIQKGRYADRNDGCDVIESNQIPQPVNWMRFIVMPKEWLEHQNQSVWEHENLHARRWHSLDLLMADVISALQWFNPFVAVFRKELELVHEYEADKAVLDSGASSRDYKIMLISAVASSRGFVMTNWLKQSNLKKRIDMMDKKQSRGINRLKVLFIPAIASLFLFATANEATAIDSTFRWPVFEDGKTWIFQDGTAKVRTFDGVVANMKVSEVADYLDHYKDFETNNPQKSDPLWMFNEYYNTEEKGTPFLQGNRTFGFKRPIFDTYTTIVTKEAKAGDVIMSVRAPVGDLNITPVDICLGRGVCSLRMKNGNQEFLYYMMKYYMPQLLNKESGTVFGSVNRNDINGLEIDIPEDEVQQKKIARYLTMLDDKIELNTEINNNLAALNYCNWQLAIINAQLSERLRR